MSQAKSIGPLLQRHSLKNRKIHSFGEKINPFLLLTTVELCISMVWNTVHDEMLCKKILVVDPFTGTKKGTVERGT